MPSMEGATTWFNGSWEDQQEHIKGKPVLVHFCKRGKRGNARTIADAILRDPAREMPLAYPYTTEIHPEHPDYVLRRPDFHFLQSFTMAVGTTDATPQPIAQAF